MPIKPNEIKLDNSCEDCIHKYVCKYQENFIKMSHEIESKLPHEDIDITIKLNCKNYLAQNKVLVYRNNS